VSGLLREKDVTIRKLELKLNTADSDKEYAEARVGDAREIQAKTRDDLDILVAQVEPEASP